MAKKKAKPWPDANIKYQHSNFSHFSFCCKHTVCPRVSNKYNFPAMYKDKKVSPAKDTGDKVSTFSLEVRGVSHSLNDRLESF